MLTYDDVLKATAAVVAAIVNGGSKAEIAAARKLRDKIEADYADGVSGDEAPFEPAVEDESPRAEFARREVDELREWRRDNELEAWRDADAVEDEAIDGVWYSYDDFVQGRVPAILEDAAARRRREVAKARENERLYRSIY